MSSNAHGATKYKPYGKTIEFTKLASYARAHRTTSLTFAVLLARILPFDLRAEEACKLFELKRRKPFAELPGRQIEARSSLFALAHPARKPIVEFEDVSSVEEPSRVNGAWPIIYTDGSKIEGKVDGAVILWRNGSEVKKTGFRLEGFASVFQVEMVAITKALDLVARGPPPVRASIVSYS